MNVYESLTNYIKTNYEPLNDWLYFNAVSIDEGNTSLNSVEGGVVTEFIDGSKDIQKLFAIAMIKQYDTGTSDINLQAMDEVNNFTEWLEQQDYEENYPYLATGYTVYEMQVLDSTPSLSVDSEQNLAKYQFNCSINYIKERN